MKSIAMFVFVIAAQIVSAQLLPHYDRSNSGLSSGSCIQSGMNQSGSSFADDSYMQAQPVMHAEDRAGITTKELYGEGNGFMINMQARPNSYTSLGVTSGTFYMMQAGAYVVPMFAQVRQNFWMTRGDGIYGATYGYAAAGPSIGIGQSILAPSFSEFFQSLTFRVGAGGMAGIGAELGGSSFGWSMFTEVGAMGLAFTAALGPQRTYAAPFLAFGIRRAFGQ